MADLRGAIVGAGYFSQFHVDAWARIPEVAIVGVCDDDPEKARRTADFLPGVKCYPDVSAMLEAERPDFLDIITPPDSHLRICREATIRGIPIICQKPLAPTLEEARALVEDAKVRGVRLMVHENFRFQPWYRAAKHVIDSGLIGSRLHGLTFRSRPGDGSGPDAYLQRQPYFRTMPRLLVHETGVHFIDTFRYLAGEVGRVFALLRRLNPVIAGEDSGILLFEFESGAVGIWDANRWNESTAEDPRYTFGEFLLEGDGGSLRLDHDGGLFLKPMGGPEKPYLYSHERKGFGGDCVYHAQRHFIDHLRTGQPFETEGAAYLRNLEIEEAFYESSRLGVPVAVPTFSQEM